MKIDEAINILKQYIDYNNPDVPDFYTMEEACEVVIKALEQENCDDCIRRSDMLDAVGHGTTYTSEEVQDIIDGMPSVTPQPCDDAVSRHAALEAFGLSEKSRKYGGDHSGYETLMKYEIQDILEDLPSVTPQPKMGRWIRVDKDKCRCDQCEVISFIAVYPNGDKNYCPNCGAKMQEVEG